MPNLAKKTKQIAGVIQLKRYEDYECYDILSYLNKYLNDNCDFYASILHNADYNVEELDTGEVIRTKENNHIHFVAQFSSAFQQTRIKTHINNICDAINDNLNDYDKLSIFAISCDYAKDLIDNTKYLLHARPQDAQKHRYERELILSNNQDLVDCYLDSESNTFTPQYLYTLLKE